MTTAATRTRRLARWPSALPTFLGRIEGEGIAYLSHSRVSLYERCPRCYHRRYVLGDDDVTTAMEIGTAFHDAARRMHAARGTSAASREPRLPKRGGFTGIERRQLANALTVLSQKRWADHDIVAVEEPFFLDLHPELPPICGSADLILRRGRTFVVVDHKTTRRFSDRAGDQLVLYAAHVRARYGAARVTAHFDEYRLVEDLTTIRSPAFRRTTHRVGVAEARALASRYARAWSRMRELTVESWVESGS